MHSTLRQYTFAKSSALDFAAPRDEALRAYVGSRKLVAFVHFADVRITLTPSPCSLLQDSEL